MKEFYPEIKLELYFLLFGFLSTWFWWNLGIDFNFWLDYFIIVPTTIIYILSISIIAVKWYKWNKQEA